jgi:hypothetical protein
MSFGGFGIHRSLLLSRLFGCFFCLFLVPSTGKLKLNFSNLEPSGLNSASIWTNNNAESIHNLMKIDVNWKPQSTPALIKVLSDMLNVFWRFWHSPVSSFEQAFWLLLLSFFGTEYWPSVDVMCGGLDSDDLIKFQVPVGRNFSIISTTFFNQN